MDVKHGCMGERAYPHQIGKDKDLFRPPQTLNKAIQHQNYLIPNLDENLHKLHGMKYIGRRRQRSLSKHSPDITIILDDHHVYTMGSLQTD